MDLVDRLKARDLEWDEAKAIAIEFTADDALLMQDAAAEIERLRAVLELIAGQSTQKLEAMQAKAALTNIGPKISA